MPLAAAITGGFGLLNGAVSAVGQKYAADRYLEGVQQTNEQNYKIWQEQQQHNLDMFNVQNDANVRNWQNQFDQTNAYNTALAQRQRLEEAGLNPSLMMQGGNAGVASSSGIPTATAQPANAPQMQSPGFVESPLVAFAQSAIQSLQGIAQALNLNSQTETEDALREPRVANTEADTKKKTNEAHLAGAKTRTENYNTQKTAMEARSAELQAKYDESTLETRIQLNDQILQHTIQQRIGQELSNDAQSIINEFLPVQQQANVALTSYNAVKAYYDGQLSAEEVRTEIKRQLLIGEQIETENEKQKTEKTEQEKNQSDIEVNNSIIGVNNATKGKINEETKGIKEDNRGKKISNDEKEAITDFYIDATIKTLDAQGAKGSYDKEYYDNQKTLELFYRKEGYYEGKGNNWDILNIPYWNNFLDRNKK